MPSRWTTSFSTTAHGCVSTASGGGSFQEIEYCPWCGRKLPPPLTEEWYDRVRELGFENPWLGEDDDLPEELRDHRWWKQAGR